jgi:MFS family permease
MRTRKPVYRVRHCGKCMGITALSFSVASVFIALLAGIVEHVLSTDYWWVLVIILIPGMAVVRYLDRTLERAHIDGHPGLEDRESDRVDRDVPSLGRHACTPPLGRHAYRRAGP